MCGWGGGWECRVGWGGLDTLPKAQSLSIGLKVNFGLRAWARFLCCQGLWGSHLVGVLYPQTVFNSWVQKAFQ